MDKKTFHNSIVKKLMQDDISSLDAFEAFQNEDTELYKKIEFTHEFLDVLCFKLKQSKSTMDKDILAAYLFKIFQQTFKAYRYNLKFISSQFKSIVTYYRNHKQYSKAIQVLEFLIQHGITDNDSEGFHIQLDKMYRKRIKFEKKLRMKD